MFAYTVYPIVRGRKPTYLVRFKLGNAWKSKQAPIRLQTESEVKAWFESEIIPNLPLPHTMVGLIHWWLENKPRHHSTRSYLNHLRAHPIGRKELSSITVQDATTFIRQLDLAPNTISTIINTFRGMVNDAILSSKLPVDTPNVWAIRRLVPSALGKKVETKAGKVNTIVLTHEQVLALTNCKTPEKQVRYLLALGAGLRRGEIAGLEWRDLDLANGLLKVERQWNSVAESLTPPKAESYRTIPMHPKLWEKIIKWRKQAYLAEDTPVLPGRTYHPSDRMRMDLLRANLPDYFIGRQDVHYPLTFHALRRTFATMLDELDVPLQRISALMGHSVKGVTAQAYLAKNQVRSRQDIDRLPL
jgi:integrase